MRSDEQLLGQVPDYISFESMLKATPAEEAGERFIYLEASREERDQQNEIVLQKALGDSADHFIKFGNIDIDHKTIPAVARRLGIADPEMWEVGAPVEVKFRDGVTFVKAKLYSGDTPLAARANMVWDSMTKLNPPKRWYPSVGGSVLEKAIRIDPATKERVAVVSKVRWTNLAISQQPVNQHVGGISTVPFGALAKSWVGGELIISKALEAGYGSDVSQLTGGSAMRIQSLDGVPQSYTEFRDRFAKKFLEGASGMGKSTGEMAAFCGREFGLSSDEAAEWVSRFLRDLKTGLRSKP